MGHTCTGYRAMRLRHWQRRLVVPVAVLLAAGLYGTGAAAQESRISPSADPSLPAAPPSDAVCEVRADSTIMPPIGDAAMVIAICGGQGLLLGHADRFETRESRELGAVLATLHRDGVQRVLLISRQEGDAPLLEDLGGQIALAAGRGPMSPIDGIEVEAAGFARDGAITVRGEAARGESTATRTIPLAPQIAQARASGLHAQPTEGQ